MAARASHRKDRDVLALWAPTLDCVLAGDRSAAATQIKDKTLL